VIVTSVPKKQYTPDNPNRNNILQAKAQAFRYIWSGHSTAPTASTSDAPAATPECNQPGDWDFFASGYGWRPLPEYDYSPFGDANIGGRDILVSLGPLWICPTINKVFGFITACFRQQTGDGLGLAGVSPRKST